VQACAGVAGTALRVAGSVFFGWDIRLRMQAHVAGAVDEENVGQPCDL